MSQSFAAPAEEICRRRTMPGTTMPFDVLNTPGAYICNWSGHLLRVPNGAVTLGSSVGLNIIGSEPLTVTKLSDNPNVPLFEAKRLAADLKLDVNF